MWMRHSIRNYRTTSTYCTTQTFTGTVNQSFYTSTHRYNQIQKQPSSNTTNTPSVLQQNQQHVPQYWKPKNIAKFVYEQEKLKAGVSNETDKKKSSDIVKHVRTIKRGLLVLTRGFVDIILHPSHIPSLLKRLWISIKHEANHYWTGTKLLAAEVRTAYKLVRKTTKGQSLTRRERRQLRRTSQDLMRIVPFSVFVIVPFMELLLPIALKAFPNMLPSTYQSASFREQQLKRELNARLNVAGFLQESMESLAKQQIQAEDPSIKSSAEDLLNILKAVRSGQRVKTDDLVRVASLFDDEITLDSLSHYQLVLICKLLSIPIIGTDEMMRYAIDMKMRRIHRDDIVIARDGLDSLDDEELRAACRARGMRDFGLTVEGFQRNLQQWLDLSLNKRIPDSLLLLSRALSISEQPSAEDVRVALSSLSLTEQSLEEWGISDNEQKLALIRRQNELIAQEEADQKQQEKVKERSEPKSTVDVAAPKVTTTSANADDLKSIMESILSMTQSSAVAVERERLESMIARVEQDQRDEAEQALIKRLRPRMASKETNGKHPIQTLDDLAKWNAVSHQNEADSVEVSTQSSDAPQDEDHEKADDKSSAYQTKVREKLLAQLKKLQDRISEIDEEIGTKLHLVQIDSLGRIDDAELHRALKQLTGASDELTTKTIQQIKTLVKTDGQAGVHLTLDDFKRLAQQQQSNEDAREE